MAVLHVLLRVFEDLVKSCSYKVVTQEKTKKELEFRFVQEEIQKIFRYSQFDREVVHQMMVILPGPV